MFNVIGMNEFVGMVNSDCPACDRSSANSVRGEREPLAYSNGNRGNSKEIKNV